MRKTVRESSVPRFRTLYQTLSPHSVPALFALLIFAFVARSSAQVEDRLSQVRQLGTAGAEAVPQLIEALADEHPEVRSAAALSLRAIGPEAHLAVPALIELFENDETTEVRRSAARALLNIGPAAKSALPSAVAAMDDEDPLVRSFALTVMNKVAPGSETAFIGHLDALNDPSGRVRRIAVIGLSEIAPGDERAMEAFIGALRDEDTKVRNAASTRLHPYGPKAAAALPAYLDWVALPDAEYRWLATMGIRNLGYEVEGVLPALENLSEDKDEQVREIASGAIESLQISEMLAERQKATEAAVGIALAEADSPEEQFRALEQAYQRAVEAANDAARAPGTQQQRKLASDIRYPDPGIYASRVFKIAQDYPNDPAALDALIWVVRHESWSEEAKEALAILAREYAEHERIGEVCERPLSFHPANEELLRAVIERNSDRRVRGHACLTLGNLLHERSVSLPKFSGRNRSLYERQYGDEFIRRIIEAGSGAFLSEAQRLFELVISEYADVATDRGTLGEIAEKQLSEVRTLSVGKVAPEIVGTNIDGETMKLSDFRGKVVFLVFTGHWCGPCRAMYPHEREIVERLKDKPFALIAINSDRDVSRVRRVAEEEEMTWPIWFDGGSTRGPIATQWNVTGWPETFVLDDKGVIRYRKLRGESIDAAVDALLAEMGIQ